MRRQQTLQNIGERYTGDIHDGCSEGPELIKKFHNQRSALNGTKHQRDFGRAHHASDDLACALHKRP